MAVHWFLDNQFMCCSLRKATSPLPAFLNVESSLVLLHCSFWPGLFLNPHFYDKSLGDNIPMCTMDMLMDIHKHNKGSLQQAYSQQKLNTQKIKDILIKVGRKQSCPVSLLLVNSVHEVLARAKYK